MRALTILAAVGWCAVSAGVAQADQHEYDSDVHVALMDDGTYADSKETGLLSSRIDGPAPRARTGVSVQLEDFGEPPMPLGFNSVGAREIPPRHQVTLSSSFWSTSGLHSISGAAGRGTDPALGPPMSFMRRYAGVDSPDTSNSGHWLHGGHENSQVLTLGYAWRDVHFEGSAFSGRTQEEGIPPASERLKLDSRSARLTFKPSSNWSVQFSKGSLGALDQVVAGGDVRRTTLSTTYRQSFEFGEWESTVAWGRNARRSRETTVGYLAESSLRLENTHVFFGRIERVGSDELLRQNESFQRTPFKLSKLTLGYFQDVRATPTMSMDVGVLVSRYLVPSHVAPSYGDDPTACMAFVRLKFR